jgi:hypothetical protein
MLYCAPAAAHVGTVLRWLALRSSLTQRLCCAVLCCAVLCRSDRYLAVHSRFFMREIRVIAYQQFLESYRVRLAGWQAVRALPAAQQLFA